MIKTTDGLRLRGRYVLEARDKKTGLLVARRSAPNLVVTLGKQLTARLLLQGVGVVSGHVGPTYQAIGTGTTAPNVGDTQLQTETARNPITSAPDTGSNLATWATYFTAAQSTTHIKEVGVFGDGASGTVNSGVLFSRALLDYDNSAGLNNITLAYVLTVG